jgi:hypothetical protein
VFCRFGKKNASIGPVPLQLFFDFSGSVLLARILVEVEVDYLTGFDVLKPVV